MNNSYDKYEEEVSVRGILWYCVRHWRSIIAIALIGLILGAGVAVLKSKDTAAQDSVDGEKKVEQMATKNIYELAEKRVEGIQKYVDETRLLEFNPYELFKGTVTFSINTPIKDSEAISNTLYSYVYNGRLYEELSEETGLYSTKDLVKLIAMSQKSGDSVIVSDGTGGGQFATTITITVLGQTKAEAEKMLLQIEDSVGAFLNELTTTYSISDYHVIDTTITESYSTELADYQSWIQSKVVSEKDSLEDLKTEFSEEDLEEAPPSGGIDKKDLILYAGAGFVGGIIIAFVLWIVVFLVSGKLYTISNYERRFAVRFIGVISKNNKRTALDKWIEQKRGNMYATLQTEEQRKLVLLNIKHALNNTETIRTVFLTSSVEKGMEEAELLKAELENSGYTVKYFNNVIGRTDILEEMSEKDVAIVLENENVSNIVYVEEELAMLRQYVGNIAGIVLVNN